MSSKSLLRPKFSQNFITTLPFQNGSHLPTTQCACADFVDFATQRNGGREKIYNYANFLSSSLVNESLEHALSAKTTGSFSNRIDFKHLPWLGSRSYVRVVY
jgi:hypothetical protein